MADTSHPHVKQAVDAEDPQTRVLAKLAILSAFITRYWPGAVKQLAKCGEVAPVVVRMDGVADAALLHEMEAKIDATLSVPREARR
jgi:hypothetical protein